MFFSPKQVAESIGVSGSTVRRYATVFDDLLSVYANPGEGKRRSFTSADVEMLRLARSYLGAGLSEQQTREQLANRQPAAVSVREPADGYYGLPLEQALAIVADQKPLLDAQARLIAEQGTRIGRLETRLERLSQEIETLRASVSG